MQPLRHPYHRPPTPPGLNPRLHARLSQRVGPVTIAAEGIAAAPAVVAFHPGRGRMESRHPDLGESYILAYLWMTADPLTAEPRRFLAICSARDCLKTRYRDFEELVRGRLDAAGRREPVSHPVLPGRPRG